MHWLAAGYIVGVSFGLGIRGGAHEKTSGSLGSRERDGRTGRVRVLIVPAAALAAGTYAPPGSSGTPHYMIEINSAEGTAFPGLVTRFGVEARRTDLPL